MAAFDRLPLSLRLLACALAGAANIFSFAPFGAWPLQLVLLGLLLKVASDDGGVRRNLLLGGSFGFGWMVAGIHWLYVSMHRYGEMPAPMAILAVILLALYMAGFYGFALAAAAWLRRRWRATPAVALLLLYPACFALGEWLRGWVFTGFPWVASGYAHAVGPLAGYAPVVGVYGLGWLAALVAGCLALLPRHRVPLVAALVVLGAGPGLKQVAWTHAAGQPITVRLLQGNVPQEMKFDREQLAASLALYRDMATAAPADLVATPETALPVFLHRLPPEYVAGLQEYARTSGAHLLIGVPVSEGPDRFANSTVGIGPQSVAADGRPSFYRYDKHHLVPFGEFVPWGFRWFVEMMKIPLGDFSGAPVDQPAFRVKDQAVLPNICYEDLFGEEIAAQIRAGRGRDGRGATILLNQSNIAWFGDTLALPHHLQISQLRALETGRPMLRATNTGVTAVIDPQGRATAVLRPYTRDALVARVQGMEGATPYVLFGNGLMLVLAGASLAMAFARGRHAART